MEAEGLNGGQKSFHCLVSEPKLKLPDYKAS